MASLEVTDQRTAGEDRRVLVIRARVDRTLPTGYVIGKREVFLIFDFAVLSELFRYRSASP